MSEGAPHPREPLVVWAVATRALPGEDECGDRHVVTPFAGGVLAGAVDGLGHGAEAAAAAEAAVRELAAHAHEPVVSLVQRTQQALLKTRGVVMSLASFAAGDRTMSWIGVGNVEGLLFRSPANGPAPPERLLLRGGVVGYQLPMLQAAAVPVAPGDTLVFATDGVRSEFDERVVLEEPPHLLAGRLLALHGKPTDDALVLVVRFTGGRSS